MVEIPEKHEVYLMDRVVTWKNEDHDGYVDGIDIGTKPE